MRKIHFILVILAIFTVIGGLIVLNTDKAWAIQNCATMNCGQWACGTICNYEGITYMFHPYSTCPNQPPGYPEWCIE